MHSEGPEWQLWDKLLNTAQNIKDFTYMEKNTSYLKFPQINPEISYELECEEFTQLFVIASLRPTPYRMSLRWKCTIQHP